MIAGPPPPAERRCWPNWPGPWGGEGRLRRRRRHQSKPSGKIRLPRHPGRRHLHPPCQPRGHPGQPGGAAFLDDLLAECSAIAAAAGHRRIPPASPTAGNSARPDHRSPPRCCATWNRAPPHRGRPYSRPSGAPGGKLRHRHAAPARRLRPPAGLRARGSLNPFLIPGRVPVETPRRPLKMLLAARQGKVNKGSVCRRLGMIPIRFQIETRRRVEDRCCTAKRESTMYRFETNVAATACHGNPPRTCRMPSLGVANRCHGRLCSLVQKNRTGTHHELFRSPITPARGPVSGGWFSPMSPANAPASSCRPAASAPGPCFHAVSGSDRPGLDAALPKSRPTPRRGSNVPDLCHVAITCRRRLPPCAPPPGRCRPYRKRRGANCSTHRTASPVTAASSTGATAMSPAIGRLPGGRSRGVGNKPESWAGSAPTSSKPPATSIPSTTATRPGKSMTTALHLLQTIFTTPSAPTSIGGSRILLNHLGPPSEASHGARFRIVLNRQEFPAPTPQQHHLRQAGHQTPAGMPARAGVTLSPTKTVGGGQAPTPGRQTERPRPKPGRNSFDIG